MSMIVERGPWNSFRKDLTDAYEKIVHWNRNLFMMQSGKSAAEKKYIQEITRLLKPWIQDSPLKTITFKTVQVRPLLLL